MQSNPLQIRKLELLLLSFILKNKNETRTQLIVRF